MRAFKVIRDPEAFQLLADETRRRIVYLLRAKEMTVSQLAEELDRTPQAIYHHIRKMKDAGLVEVAREERVDHFIETYYRATAEIFHLTMDKGGPPGWAESKTQEALKQLGQLGVHTPTDPETVARIVDLERRLVKLGANDAWTERIAEMENVDFLTKQDLEHYMKFLLMTDDEFAEYLRLSRDLRKLLRSTLEAPPKAH